MNCERCELSTYIGDWTGHKWWSLSSPVLLLKPTEEAYLRQFWLDSFAFNIPNTDYAKMIKSYLIKQWFFCKSLTKHMSEHIIQKIWFNFLKKKIFSLISIFLKKSILFFLVLNFLSFNIWNLCWWQRPNRYNYVDLVPHVDLWAKFQFVLNFWYLCDLFFFLTWLWNFVLMIKPIIYDCDDF